MTAAEIFEKHSKPLLAFIRSRVSRAEDAEDILQDVFYSFLKADGLLFPVERAAAWFYHAAKNKIIDRWRKKKEDALPDYIAEEDSLILDIESALQENSSENEYLRGIISLELERALAELPQNQREVFIATEVEGVTFKELSEKTGAPLGTLLSRKRYAVLTLRERLKDLYADLMTT